MEKGRKQYTATVKMMNDIYLRYEQWRAW